MINTPPSNHFHVFLVAFDEIRCALITRVSLVAEFLKTVRIK